MRSGPPQDPIVTSAEGLGRALAAIVRTAWSIRLEIALVVALVWLAHYVKTGPQLIAWPLLLVVLVAMYFGRRVLLNALHVARVRRQWTRAMEDCGLADRCRKVTRCSQGERLDVRIRRGHAVTGLESKCEELAACLKVREVRVERDRRKANRATVTLIRNDPFEDAPPILWPGLDGGSFSVWDKEVIGTQEDGRPLTMKLVGNQVLVAGTTGAGKSVFMRVLLAIAALSTDPVKLWLFDAKRLELSPWKRVAEDFVGRDGKRAVEVLSSLQQIADARQQEIEAIGADKIRRKSGLPVHVIVIDELAEYAVLKEGQQIMDLVRSLASQGRALGIVVIAATQYPHSSIIDTTLRGQLKTIVGFRVRDRHHGGTVFGQGDVAQLASEIPEGLPGVGYAYDETGRVTRFRSAFIGRPDDDAPDRRDDVLHIVKRAEHQRESSPVTERGESTVPLRGTGVDGPGSGPGSGPPVEAGRSAVDDVAAAIGEHLSDEPLSAREVARRLGRKPDDGTVRRALGRLEEEGRAERTEAGYVRSDDQSPPPS